MKRLIFTVLSLIFLQTQLFSQTFIDDFESYTPGSFLALSSTNWDTWNNTPGGPDDVLITSANANSGLNSIYFSSNIPNGGPEDIVLRFPSAYTNGQVELEANFFIEQGKGAIFYLLETWSTLSGIIFSTHMRDDSVLFVSNSTSFIVLSTNYPIGQWFNFRVKMDLDNNVWEVFIDNISQGLFTNNVGSVGMLDLYPYNPAFNGGNSISGFYVDDVSLNYTFPASIRESNVDFSLFDIFPNPSKGMFFIEVKEHFLDPFSLTIKDLSGKIVWQENYTSVGNKKISFPSSLLSNGVYLVSLESNGNIDSKKLVIQ